MKLINKSSYIVILCLLALLIYVYMDMKSNSRPWITIDENILDAKVEKDKNIFFIETKSSEFRKLTAHQSCSIESAANIYPEKNVYVLFTNDEDSVELKQTLMIKALKKYKNIHFKHMNIKEFAKNTPLEDWMSGDKLTNSKFQIEHTADVLRLLTLWRFGGLYLDLDVIVLKKIHEKNFVCFEDDVNIANGIIDLSGATGREFAEKFMSNQVENFNGDDWAANGPAVMSRVLEAICPSNGSLPNKCGNFTLVPRKNCYEIGWPEWMKFFEENDAQEVKERTRESNFVHLWNKLCQNFKVGLNSHAAIIGFAKNYCPAVFLSRYDDF